MMVILTSRDKRHAHLYLNFLIELINVSCLFSTDNFLITYDDDIAFISNDNVTMSPLPYLE